MKIDLSIIIAESKKLGLDLVSFSGPEFLYSEYEKLKDWQSRGYAAGMSFMLRPPDLLCDPRRLFENTKSVLVFALYYDRSKAPQFKKGFGRVARYAWGKDYHIVIKKRLKLLLERLKEVYSEEIEFRVFSDAVPMLERAIAKNAGLGFVGKNSMLIKPKSGSYFFIAEILSNIEIVDKRLPLITENCGSCKKCKTSCPTGAIVEDHVIDSNRCISYLTIEKKGKLSPWESEALGEWVFGCDICQEVCPFNHSSLKTEQQPVLEDFSFEQGVGALLDLPRVLSIRSKQNFTDLFAGTALMRAGRESLLRNAAIVVENTSAEICVESLKTAFLEDTSETVRGTCLRSLSNLNRKCNILSNGAMNSLLNKAFNEDANVYDEYEIF
jgi:epoxyqueuosine reductase